MKQFSAKELEGKILEFWQKNKIFEKSLSKSSKLKAKSYTFYDGPPFATGLPHYGHILASTIKDVIPRYQTMKGKYVERVWGWDCHGLPIENIAEKELGIKRKKEIEKMGIAKFNEFCRSKVLDYAEDWKKVIAKLGRWADMENAYKTMDVSYMESVWWVFKELWDKGLVYEGYRSMYICPRCETTLSQQEVAEGYKDIKDLSATVKFEVLSTKYENDTNIRKDAEEKTYILAWTTTPWTLLGNVALAVGEKISYVKVKVENEFYILAKERVDIILKDRAFEIIKEFKGKDLVGKQYKALFDYPVNKNIPNKENGWKIYAADFVTTEDGTGVVHIAPAFGEDDLQLGQKNNLPFIQHVGMDGIIKPGYGEFSGLSVKPSEDHQKTDVEIIKYLAQKNLLFAKEKYEHSYPHCWRCDTLLINYATSSWFVNITKIKGRALELAKKINWIPPHIKEGRFGNWLEGARDWSISRQRYWASAIPIWRCEKCSEVKVAGSIEDIRKNVKKSGNRYFVMRHGEAETNVVGILNSDIKKNHFHLTVKGKKMALASAKKLKKYKIDVVFSSDFVRTKETAEIVSKEIGLIKSKIIFDKRLREINMGIFDGKKLSDYLNYFPSVEEKFYKTPPKGENFLDVKKRITEFLYEIDAKYKNKNILIVGHEGPLWALSVGAIGADNKKAAELKKRDIKKDYIKYGEVKDLDFSPMPHNQNYELDLHRPYIDRVEFSCLKCEGDMKRISDVLDTWFDSGSMPYAQVHYPFENKKKFDNNFPAEFIAEGVDQTRAWFYYLHSIATAIKNSNAYKNVVVNGIVLAEDGKKMSKKLQNYPDPVIVMEKYGADALRLYLMSSPVVRAENLNFSEKGVDEVYKKTILRLWNSFSFYKLYTNSKAKSYKLKATSSNVLDKWILARLQETINQVGEVMDKYELDKASRPISDFVEDLSTWYIRRSRDRFKDVGKDKESAIETTRFVLNEFSKAIAPIVPFISDALYLATSNKSSAKSVHLEDFPKTKKLTTAELSLLEKMKEIRKFAELTLAKRQEAGIKVRQPLKSLKLKSERLKGQKNLLGILADEINVKKVVIDARIKGEIELDIEITQELKEEGQIRELTRMIQDLRKQAGYQPKDTVVVNVECETEIRKLMEKYGKELKKAVGAKEVEFKRADNSEVQIEAQIDGQKIWLGIRKI